MNSFKTNSGKLFLILLLSMITFACGKVTVSTSTSSSSDNQLYFCESYDTGKGEINKSDKFTTGSLTVIVNCQGKKQKLGVSEVDLKITDLSNNEVIATAPFTVNPDLEYVYFNNVAFNAPGKYKVSCDKKDGSTIASGQVEIITK